ncbi:Lrp/AsnC family transcriptional regulator [Amycolatopsis sp. NPDC004368]
MISPRLEPGDDALFAALAHDGRASLATLASASGRSETTVRRRLEHLRTSGALYFDVEVDAALLGASLSALLWLSVTPSRLDAVAREVATYPEVAVFLASAPPRRARSPLSDLALWSSRGSPVGGDRVGVVVGGRCSARQHRHQVVGQLDVPGLG